MKADQSPPKPTKRLEDPHSFRALAHPLRLRLLGQLRTAGPAKATTLAAAFDESVPSVSYHLRQLGKHGFIEEATELARDGRERWWRASHVTTSWSAVDFLDSPEGLAAEAAFASEVHRTYFEVAQRWLNERVEWDEQWVDAASTGDQVLRLAPGELKGLMTRLHELVDEYNERAPSEDAETVHVILQAYPFRAPL
ncbi:MAG: helix-turn-helix domain-containing protein [Actinomycetota bacterium]